MFAAEWGVFAALQFRLKAKPSDVAFHFRRLMKTLGYDPRRYLGSQVYGFWQEALAEEEFRRQEWEARVQTQRDRKEKKKLKQLQREIEEAADIGEGRISDSESIGEKNEGEDDDIDTNKVIEERIEKQPRLPMNTVARRRLGFGDIFKNRIVAGNTTGGLPKRSASTERSWSKLRSNVDTVPSVTQNVDTSVTANGISKQRSRLQLLRPLSQSKSMLSLSAEGNLDEISESKKSQIELDDLEEERSDWRQHGDEQLIAGEEEGIII